MLPSRVENDGRAGCNIIRHLPRDVCAGKLQGMTLPCLGLSAPDLEPRGRYWIERPAIWDPPVLSGSYWIERPAIRGLGAAMEGSQIHIRAIDRSGAPLKDTKVTVRAGEFGDRVWTSNGDGVVVDTLNAPVGTPVVVDVELPEGIARRQIATVLPTSGAVELFQSVVQVPKPFVLLGEGISLLAGGLLIAAGLSAKNARGSSVATGIGTSLVGLGSFSFTYRHLR